MLFHTQKSQDEIDLEYDLSLTVSDLGNWIEWFSHKSLLARQELDCMLDIPYGFALDETVDIFPAKEPGGAILVFIHGGYWVLGESKDYCFVANGFVHNGITVVMANYSKCPKVTIPEISQQSRSMIAWLYREAPNFGADPSKIFISGHSAGGHQAAMLSITDWANDYGLPGETIKGCIMISGIFDLQPLFFSYLQPKLQLTHKEILNQSPTLNIPDNGPPLLIIFGEKETKGFQQQSTEFYKKWKARGLAGELFIQEGKHHFSILENLSEANSELCQEIINFMKINSP